MQDQFTPSEVRDIIPDIFSALISPTHALYRPFSEISPSGYDVSKFGRVSSSKVRTTYYNIAPPTNTKDGTTRVSRILRQGECKVTVTVHRDYGWKTVPSWSGGSYYAFGDEYSVHVTVEDYELAVPGVDESFYTYRFHTRKVKYDGTKSFRDFLVNDIADEFNNNGAQFLDEWEKRKNSMRKMMAALSKYK